MVWISLTTERMLDPAYKFQLASYETSTTLLVGCTLSCTTLASTTILGFELGNPFGQSTRMYRGVFDTARVSGTR